MTKNEALKIAIEALSQDEGWFEPEKAIQACKEALEQPAQEPIYIIGEGWKCDKFPEEGTKLYTQPAPSWQGLSDEEISHLKYLHVDYELFDEGEYGTECNVYVDDFAHAIEQELKEKNSK